MTMSKSRNSSTSSNRNILSAGGEGNPRCSSSSGPTLLLGVKHAIGVTSGTTALYTAMAAMEIGPGDEVILPAWTWYSDYDSVVLSGACRSSSTSTSRSPSIPTEIEAKITPRTKVIVPSHLQGGLADMDVILEIARKHKLRVLEDCAQCCGGKYKGKYVGTLGDMGINSFQLSKTITSGEGGAVVTNDGKLFERALRFHDVGALRSPYTEELKGGLLAAFTACNFRMNEFTGAVLKGQLQKLDTICSRLRAHARQGAPRRFPVSPDSSSASRRTSRATWAWASFWTWAPRHVATTSCTRWRPRECPRNRPADP